jgi:hypothetical protein
MAISLINSVRWKVGICFEGSKCWCRTVVTEEELTDEEGWVIEICGYGNLDEEKASAIAENHNKIIENRRTVLTEKQLKLY